MELDGGVGGFDLNWASKYIYIWNFNLSYNKFEKIENKYFSPPIVVNFQLLKW